MTAFFTGLVLFPESGQADQINLPSSIPADLHRKLTTRSIQTHRPRHSRRINRDALDDSHLALEQHKFCAPLPLPHDRKSCPISVDAHINRLGVGSVEPNEGYGPVDAEINQFNPFKAAAPTQAGEPSLPKSRITSAVHRLAQLSIQCIVRLRP